MPPSFNVKVPIEHTTSPSRYVVVTYPKCGKKTYDVAGLKGKKCPICRRQFSMPGEDASPRFATPQETCHYIQAEETNRAGRMDFTSVGGYRPAACAPTSVRTSNVMAM